MASTILIIDDDKKLNQLLTEFLSDFGFNTISSTHPQGGLKKLKQKSPDLVILDVMLPGMDGFELCKTIRQNSSVPIIMLTARGELMDKVIGVDALKKRVITENFKITYDYLVIATGSQHSYFGNDDWEAIAPGLKNIDDATEIRRRILLAFEQAETTINEEEKKVGMKRKGFCKR